MVYILRLKKIAALQNIVKWLVCISMVLCFTSQINAQTFSTATDLAKKMTLGWNIGNTMEALYINNGVMVANENAWGHPNITQLLIDSVKAAGFNTIRIPVAWDSHSSNSVIDAAWIARVKQVVDYCYSRDLYIILNIHWDNGWLEENCTAAAKSAVNTKQQTYWTQIANYFKAYDEHLLFASANEPNVDDASQMSVLLSYHQTFINAVRATGGNNLQRILIVQGPRTDIEKTNTLMTTMPTDPTPNKLMAEVHFYPYQFTLMKADESWGNQFYYWGACNHSTTDPSHNPTWGEEAWVDQMFQLMKVQFVNKGVPVVLGEFGVRQRTELSGSAFTLHNQSREYFLKYVVKSAKNHGMIPVYWCAGLKDMFDRNTGQVLDRGALNAMMAGAYSTSTTVNCGTNDCKGVAKGHAYTNTAGQCVLGYVNPVSTLPIVTLTTPTANQTYTAPATVSIAATATASTGRTINRVEFFNGTTKLGEDLTVPYTFSWTNVASGTYSITAVARDNTGAQTTSAPISIRVNIQQGAYGGTPHQIPGTIQFENYDEGGNGVAYFDDSPGSAVTPIVNFRTTEDVDIETCTDTGGGYNIGYANAGEWLEYTVNVAATGIYTLTLRVACNGDGRTVSVSSNGTAIANNVAIPNTTGWQVWQNVTIPNINLTAGTQVLRITMGATNFVNMNYMTFASASTPAPTVSSPISYCQGATATALTATGTALKWYTTATGGTASTIAPTPNTSIVGTTTYYVSQTVNGVESSRASIVVTIIAKPSNPTVITPVNYIVGQPSTALIASGTALKWYTVATGGTANTIAPTPSTATVSSTSYYVSQTVATCESNRATISVVVSKQTIALKAGWNLVGCPISGSTDINKALSSIWSNVEIVKDFNSFYSSSNNPALNSLQKLDWGRGYFIKVTSNCELNWEVN